MSSLNGCYLKRILKIINSGVKCTDSVGGNTSNYSYYGKQHECSIKTANWSWRERAIWSSCPITRLKPEGHEIRIQERHLHIQFTTALFPVDNIGNQLKYQQRKGLKSEVCTTDDCYTTKKGILAFLGIPWNCRVIWGKIRHIKTNTMCSLSVCRIWIYLKMT